MAVKKSTAEVDPEAADEDVPDDVVAEDPLDDEPDLPELPPDEDAAPEYGPPAPITPDTPTDEAQRRIGLERLVNGQVEAFIASIREPAVDHLLAGRSLKLVAVNADGSDYSDDE